MDKKDRRIRRLIEGDLLTDQDTNNLIQSFDSRSNNDIRSPVWDQSTTDIINTDIKSLAVSVPREVSESTVIINRDHVPITPLRRTVSGSSLDIMHSSSSSLNQDASSSIEINLDILYLLLEKLPQTFRYIHFKGILLNYISLLQEHADNVSSDRFIITIYNQLRKPSDHNKLKKIIDIFIDEPANTHMKMSNFTYFKKFNLRSKYFKFWVIKRRKLSNLEEVKSLFDLHIKKKYLSKWVLNYDIVTDEFQANADHLRRTSGLLNIWAIWKSKINQIKSSNQFADDKQRQYYLNIWKENLIFNLNNGEIADNFYQRNLSNKIFRNWKLKTVETSSSILLKKKSFFSNWKKNYKNIESLNQDGKFLEIAFHAGFFFTKWKAKAEFIKASKSTLLRTADNFLISKYFDNWLEEHRYKLIENNVLQKSNEFLKIFILKQWLKRLEHRKMLEQYKIQEEIKVKSNILNKWKKHSSLKFQAVQYDDKTMISNHFKIWRLNSTARFYQNDKDFETIDLIWEQWKEKTLLNFKLKEFESKSINKYWEKWKFNKLKSEGALELGNKTSSLFTKKSFFNSWRQSIKKNEVIKSKSDQFLLKKFLNKWKLKQKELNDMEIKANNFYATDPKNVVKSYYWKAFVDKYDESIDSRVSLKLDAFETKTNKNKLQTIFRVWNEQYHSYLTQERIFKEDYLNLLYVEPIFSQWIYKLSLFRQLEFKADERNALNLLSSGFNKMKLQLSKVQQMNEAAIEIQQDKDLQLIVKLLKHWSLKSFKTKRDNETIKTFNGRWNRAHLRAILLLWKGRTFDYIEDDSPTKSKVVTSMTNFQTQTPQKAIIDTWSNYSDSSSIFRSAIPGSEKIKRKRIEELKSHYSQIKYAIPSPLKQGTQSLPLSTTKKLVFTKTRNSSQSNNNESIESSEKVDDIEARSINRNRDRDKRRNEMGIFNEDPISSPVISHKNILTRHSNSSRSSDLNGLF